MDKVSAVALAVLLPVVGGGVALSSPQAEAPLLVFWEGSLTSAIQRSRRVGRPVMAAMLRPSQPASREMLHRVYPDPEVRALLHEFVLVAACPDRTPTIGEGPRKGMSVFFPTMTPEEHQAVAADLVAKYVGDDDACPQHLFLDSEGHLIERRTERLEKDAFMRLLVDVLDRCDPSWRPRGSAKSQGPPTPTADRGVPWAGLFSDHEETRQKTADALLRQPDKDLVLRVFRQGDATVKSVALERVRKLEKFGWVAPLVREGLADRDLPVREQALVTSQVVALPELLPDLLSRNKKEKDEELRPELVRALAACAHGDEEALQLVLAATRAREERLRANAYIGLAAAAHNETTRAMVIDTLLKRGLRDDDNACRSAAVWALGQLRAQDAAATLRKLIPRERSKERRDFWGEALRRMEGGDVDGSRWASARAQLATERVKR